MALLHYKLIHLGTNWILSCEDVPIDAFGSRAKALRCARQLIALANQRGDTTTLQGGRPTKHPTHREIISTVPTVQSGNRADGASTEVQHQHHRTLLGS